MADNEQDPKTSNQRGIDPPGEQKSIYEMGKEIERTLDGFSVDSDDDLDIESTTKQANRTILDDFSEDPNGDFYDKSFLEIEEEFDKELSEFSNLHESLKSNGVTGESSDSDSEDEGLEKLSSLLKDLDNKEQPEILDPNSTNEKSSSPIRPEDIRKELLDRIKQNEKNKRDTINRIKAVIRSKKIERRGEINTPRGKEKRIPDGRNNLVKTERGYKKQKYTNTKPKRISEPPALESIDETRPIENPHVGIDRLLGSFPNATENTNEWYFEEPQPKKKFNPFRIFKKKRETAKKDDHLENEEELFQHSDSSFAPTEEGSLLIGEDDLSLASREENRNHTDDIYYFEEPQPKKKFNPLGIFKKKSQPLQSSSSKEKVSKNSSEELREPSSENTLYADLAKAINEERRPKPKNKIARYFRKREEKKRSKRAKQVIGLG